MRKNIGFYQLIFINSIPFKKSKIEKVIARVAIAATFCVSLNQNQTGQTPEAMRKFLVIPLLILFASCASLENAMYPTVKPYFTMEVDAYGNENLASGKKYFLASSDGTTDKENDLQYIEFAKFIKTSLLSKGYTEVLNRGEADLAIFFQYGISDPKTYKVDVAIPVWGQTGVSSISTTGSASISSYGNRLNYNQRTTATPKYGITGSTNVTQTITEYQRKLTITVYDYDEFKKTKNEKIIWNTNITSSGYSGDIRKVFPYLVAAGQGYFGQSSGERKTVSFYEGDERIKDLYRKAIGPTPEDALEYYRQGGVKRGNKDFNGAIIDYTKAIEINPGFAEAYQNRARAKGQISDLNGAIEDLSKYLDLRPNQPEAYYIRGVLRYEIGQRDGGCSDLHKAAELGYKDAGKAVKEYCKN